MKIRAYIKKQDTLPAWPPDVKLEPFQSQSLSFCAIYLHPPWSMILLMLPESPAASVLIWSWHGIHLVVIWYMPLNIQGTPFCHVNDRECRNADYLPQLTCPQPVLFIERKNWHSSCFKNSHWLMAMYHSQQTPIRAFHNLIWDNIYHPEETTNG